MEVTLKPDLQKPFRSNLLMVNYRPQKFRGLLAPTQYASVTRLSPAFRVRVWLRETTCRHFLQNSTDFLGMPSPDVAGLWHSHTIVLR